MTVSLQVYPTWRMGPSIEYVPTACKLYGLSGYLFTIAMAQVSIEHGYDKLTGERIHLVNIWHSEHQGAVSQREMTEREIKDFLEAHDLVLN